MLAEEVTQLIDKTGETRIMEVEKGAIKKYADAIDDQNLLYWDEEYAKNSRFGSIIAPPGFFGWPTKWTGRLPVFTKLSEEVGNVLEQAGHPHLLDGEIEYDFFCPVQAGDIMAASPKVIKVYERDTRLGNLIFLVIETSYINQNSSLVAKERRTYIYH